MKRLVICCDGTWNDEDAHPNVTNVVRISRAVLQMDIRKEQPVAQVTYYHAGVGTGDFFDRIAGGGIGLGLSRNVRDCYAFVAGNYVEGDEIFLFGFSRGAYTARSVAGLIGWAGLLRKPDMDAFFDLWAGYKTKNQPGAPDVLAAFPERHKTVPVRCIGVWDTVGALGIPGHTDLDAKNLYQFHDTDLGAHVAYAFHALALDERRQDFEPTLWLQTPAGTAAKQVLKQVWFPGVHSNVGGGYDEHGLSDVALAWMATQVAPLLALDMDYVLSRQDRRDGWALGRLYDSASGATWALRPKAPRQPFTKQPQSATMEATHRSAVERGAAGVKAVPSAYTLAVGAKTVAELEEAERKLRWGETVPATSPPPPHSVLHDILADLRKL